MLTQGERSKRTRKTWFQNKKEEEKLWKKNFEEFSQSEKMAAQQKQIRIGKKEKGKEI